MFAAQTNAQHQAGTKKGQKKVDKLIIAKFKSDTGCVCELEIFGPGCYRCRQDHNGSALRELHIDNTTGQMLRFSTAVPPVHTHARNFAPPNFLSGLVYVPAI